MKADSDPHGQRTTRRRFLRASAATAATTLLSGLDPARAAHALGSGLIKVGLVGCGGRGTDAAINALNAGPDVRLTAMADLFEERLAASREHLRKTRPAQVEVRNEHCFLGFEAYQRLLACDVDAVIIAPCSHFIPAIVKAAVQAGKHLFCEKPHGIDIPGVNIVRTACDDAVKKGLSVVSGLCWRFDPGVRETMQRVREGAIGDIVAIQSHYLSSPYIVRERREGQSEMEYQMWNWYHFNWLSGDQTAQQLIHSLDKASWALGDQPPRRIYGMGGRQTALEPKFGDQFDHQAVVFEYENGARVFGFTRDQPECHRDTNDYLFGTKGRCNLLAGRIEGETNWHYQKPRQNMYDIEHAEFFQSIRDSRPINNRAYMCLSSALAVAAQMACYTGAILTWDDVMNSKRSFALPRYGWDVQPPVTPGPDGRYPTAMQGQAEYDKWIA